MTLFPYYRAGRRSSPGGGELAHLRSNRSRAPGEFVNSPTLKPATSSGCPVTCAIYARDYGSPLRGADAGVTARKQINLRKQK